MKWCALALTINAVLLWFFVSLQEGVVMQVPPDTVAHFGSVFVIIILLFSNILTITAMNHGFQAFFGNVFATKGTSMVVCGFSQTYSLFKLSFANDLSLNSKVRKVLSRLAYLWILAELLKLTTPVPSTALITDVLKEDSGTTDCLEFHQGGHVVDRKWPNMNVEAGLAELVFGNSIGYLRSQLTDPLNATLAIVGPQLVGAVNDGDTIVGNGFVADIVTTCSCPTKTDNVDDLIQKGIPADRAAEVHAMAQNLTNNLQNLVMINLVKTTADYVNISSVMLNTSVCGGKNETSYPICVTQISNHHNALIEMRYMTDGTPASIAQENAKLRYLTGGADLSWVASGITNILGGDLTYYEMTPTVPGMINPLLYWCTSNLQSINPTLLDAGLETTFTMLLRAAIQRSYNTKGAKCTRNVVIESSSKLTIYPYGATTVVVAMSIQLLLSFIAAMAFIPWFLSESPAGPGIRAVREAIYFTALLADSNFSENIRSLCNAPTFAIWQGLDVVVRVGEAVETVDEDMGRITMDKPKMVRKLVNGRKYC